jgi:hypothetical protein
MAPSTKRPDDSREEFLARFDKARAEVRARFAHLSEEELAEQVEAEVRAYREERRQQSGT